MQSSLYPNIVYLTNDNLAFLGTTIAEKQQLHLLHPTNPLANHYSELVCKLFQQIKIIKEMLWIGRVPSTQIVRIYFSQPYEYPATYCCKYPVFIEVQNDRSGTVLCSKCSKEVMKFVKGGKGPDQYMFKSAQMEMKTRKDELKSLLTSLKFRGKKLRNNFISNEKTNDHDIIVEINEENSSNSNDLHKETNLTPSLLQLKQIVNDIFS